MLTRLTSSPVVSFATAKQRVHCAAHPVLCLATILPGGPRSADRIAAMPGRNPFSDEVAAMPAGDFALLSAAVAERGCREELGFGTLAEAAALYRPDPPCPRCGSTAHHRDGTSASGLARYECDACGARYGSLTGTVLEHSKSTMAQWAQFVRLMRFNVPLDAIAEVMGVSHQTAWEWRHRVFAAVDGYQDRLVLRDRVWIDEAYVSDTDLAHGLGQARKRGLSKQKLCIAVAIDVHKSPVAVVCGHGKPSTRRMKDALLSHLAEGSVVVHDKEKSHNGLIRAAKCVSEPYKADVRDPVYLAQLAMVNDLCSWLKRYLWRFTGMSMSNMQSYLNWYVYLFRVNQARDRWPETERVVRHLLMTDATFRSSRTGR